MGFKRMDGFAGSIPQGFIDRQVRRCPMCGTDKPHWHIDQKMGWVSASRYLFQCQKCRCILSCSVPDVSGIGRTLFSFEGIAKAVSGKKLKTIYLRIEEVGTAQTTQLYRGKELGLDELNQLTDSNHTASKKE